MAVESPDLASYENEEAVLGCVLIDQDAIIRISPILDPADFAREKHGWVYRAMIDLHRENRPPDYLAVCDLLDHRGQLDGVGGPGYVTGLLNAVPTSLHAEHYAEIVARYATRRRIVQAAGEVVKEAYDLKSSDPLGFMQRKSLELAIQRSGQTPPLREVVGRLYDQVEHWAAHPIQPGQVRGLDLGLPSFNQLVDGLEKGLVMLAGRPSMGKSAAAFSLGRNVAEQHKRVMLFSLEMNAEAVVARWASDLSGVDSRRIRRGLCPDGMIGKPAAGAYVSDAELSRYLAALGRIDAYPFVYIDDRANLSANDIRIRALQKANEWGGIDLVVVDHTGYIRSDGAKGENSAQVEGRKSRLMKQLAKTDLGCLVIQVQQLNRNVEERENKRPQLSDLRQTGEHEENADVVIALFRDSYYLERQGKVVPPDKVNELEVIGLKNREGPTGTRIVYYDRVLSRIREQYRRGNEQP